MEELEREIKHLIVESLNLDGVAPDSIDAAAPLFGAGLGLDSIDALELAMALRKKYGVRTTADDARNREIFSSVRSLAAFVLEEQRRSLAG
jgi:acyl carrier protein